MIEVLGCCIIAWKPPRDMGGERPGYAVRFFDGETYRGSNFRMIFRSFEDPEKNWAKLDNCPTDKPIYADVSGNNMLTDIVIMD